jgi:hypothetical protein
MLNDFRGFFKLKQKRVGLTNRESVPDSNAIKTIFLLEPKDQKAD